MKKEIADGIIPDPNAPIDPNTGMPMDASQNNIDGASGKVPIEPGINASDTEVK
jgi:hypothetical protein